MVWLLVQVVLTDQEEMLPLLRQNMLRWGGQEQQEQARPTDPSALLKPGWVA